jgi:DNA repair exonuclease SbcCD ATPase subunit
MIESLSLKEAELQANLSEGSERLATIRQQSDDEERRLRVLSEQVNTVRERHARTQADLQDLQEQVHLNNVELEAVRTEEKHARQRIDEDRTRRSEDEARRANLQAELRELMDERRTLLRELGDLGARRGHSEAELSVLVDKASALAEAHEEALADIQEAERLRARLAEEPLAQALLDDNTTFEGLGPVLERLEHARSLGYSVTLLDRAVERALQVIQSTVDHVAATPRHLLSSEVMTLLERQVPQTAGAVRGLARWSVQQRLEHQLGETVNHVVLDLEHLLEDFDRSITMLRRIRNVLEQVERLGAPSNEVHALLANCQRPEALPSLAQGTRRLIQVALDDIYLEADQRDAGEAIGLEETARVLEELITQLDASGLTDGRPRGMMWEFQRDGYLPFERENLPVEQRLPVSEDMKDDLEPSLLNAEVVTSLEQETTAPIDDEGWSELPPPQEATAVSNVPTTEQTTVFEGSLEDERAVLEAELARLDAERHHRASASPVPAAVPADAALAELESKLANLDF